MVQILRSGALLAASAALLNAHTDALKVTFKNACTFPVELYSREGGQTTADAKAAIAVGGSSTREFGKDFEGHFRHGADDAATLIEFSTKGTMNFVWYDISVIPPRLNKGFEFCKSLDECKANSQSKKGFNVPVQMTPTANTNGNQCRELTCVQDGCTDAYLFPADDTKTHACDLNTDFTVTFCPSGSSSNGGGASPSTAPVPAQSSAAPTTQAPTTPAPTTKAPTTPVPTTKAPVSPSPTMTPAPTTAAPTTQAPTPAPPPAPAPAPSSAPTPGSTPAPTSAPTPAPAPAPAPSATPEPAANGKVQVPNVDDLIVATKAPAAAPTPAPAAASKPTTAPASTPIVPAPVPTPSKKPKKNIKHCV